MPCPRLAWVPRMEVFITHHTIVDLVVLDHISKVVVTGCNSNVGTLLYYYLWLHEEPEVGGPAMRGETCMWAVAHRPHSQDPLWAPALQP